MKFIYQSIKDATLSESDLTAETGYPLTNLNDLNKNNVFKCADVSAPGVLDINFGAGQDADTLALVDFYMTGTSLTVTVEASETGGAGTYVSILSAQSVTSSTTPATWVKTISGDPLYQYYRITFAGDAGADLYLGAVFLGNELDFSHNPELNILYTNQFENTIITSQGGQRFAFGEFDDNRKGWQMVLKYINATFKTNLESWRDEVMPGELSRYPFLFYDDTNYHYVRSVGPLEFQTSADVAYDTTLVLSEEL